MNTRGFTLIELMIVVAIIGILAAVALPGYQKYRLNHAPQSTSKPEVRMVTPTPVPAVELAPAQAAPPRP